MVRREDFCLLKFLPLFSGFGGFLNISVLSTCPSLVLALPTRPFLSLFSSAWRVVRPSGVSRQHSVPAGSVVAEFCPGRIWMALSGGRTQRQQRSLADIVVLIDIVGIRIICKLVNYNLQWGMWNYVIIVCPF